MQSGMHAWMFAVQETVDGMTGVPFTHSPAAFLAPLMYSRHVKARAGTIGPAGCKDV